MKIMPRIMSVTLLSSYLITNAFAVDLGKRGQTFPVKEEGFVAMMKRKLGSVDMEQEQRKMQELAKDRANNPVAVEDVTLATKDREFYFDPSYVLTKDASLPCGKVLHKAGTTVNPLDYMQLERVLYFIDAREEAQIRWLEEQIQSVRADEHEQEELRIILVGGSVFKLKERLGNEHADKVYFDQSGEITTRFGIKASPAVAVQEGKMLKITEVKI